MTRQPLSIPIAKQRTHALKDECRATGRNQLVKQVHSSPLLGCCETPPTLAKNFGSYDIQLPIQSLIKLHTVSIKQKNAMMQEPQSAASSSTLG